MRILIDIGHPAHVHFFKYAIRRLEENDHEVLITVRPKDVVYDLLDFYGFPYQTLTGLAQSRVGQIREYLVREQKLGMVVRTFKPDVITAIGGIFIAPVAKITGIPAVVFTDSEHVKMDRILTYPLASKVITPEWFKGYAGKNQVRYKGFQEYAYLDPNYFNPDPGVLRMVGLSEGDQFALIRFISWEAGHDLGQSGFSFEQKIQLVRDLSSRMKVFVSVEGTVPDNMKPYQLTLPPEKMHDLLYYASLYIGEGATMATEAGLLRTPSVYVSSLVGTMGNFEELSRLNLVHSFQDGESGIRKAIEISEQGPTGDKQKVRRKEILSEFDDVTELIVNSVSVIQK